MSWKREAVSMYCNFSPGCLHDGKTYKTSANFPDSFKIQGRLSWSSHVLCLFKCLQSIYRKQSFGWQSKLGKLAAKINTYRKREIIAPLPYTILLSNGIHRGIQLVPTSSISLFQERSPFLVTLRMKLPQLENDMPYGTNIRIKMSLCFLCEMLKFIRKSESLISTEFLRPAICCMKKKWRFFFLTIYLL